MQGRPPAPVLIGLRAFVMAGAAGGLLARGHILFGCLLAVAAMASLWAGIRKGGKDDGDPGAPPFAGTG